MKKVLIGLLVIVMVLGLTACSQDLATLMGSMSTNVYGIEADTSEADAATAKVDNATSVEKDEDGNVVSVTVDLAAAASITADIASIKNSETKSTALKTQLAEPVASSEAEAAAVRAEIVSEASKSANKLTTAAASNSVVADLQTVLNNVTNSISENPTKAELAAVAILSEVAETVANVSSEPTPEELDSYLEQGLAAYSTLKVVSEVAEIDVFKDLDINSLINSMTSKGVSRDEEVQEEEKKKFDFSVVQKTVTTILDLLTKKTDDGYVLDTEKYNSFILQATSIKASMDLAATKFVETDPDKILEKAIDKGMTVTDLGLYLVCSIFVELDKFGVLPSAVATAYYNNDIITEAESTANHWKNLAADYIHENYDALSNLGGDKKPADPDERLLYLFALALDSNIDGSLAATTKDEITEELGADIKNAIANNTSSQFTVDVYNILRTVAVIIVDSDSKYILDFAGDGTIKGLLSLMDKK